MKRTHAQQCTAHRIARFRAGRKLGALTAVALCLLVWQSIVVAQEQTPPSQPPERVARLIRDLGANSYLKREAAGEQLRALGRDSILPLEAVKDSTDPEVRVRATELLRELKMSAMWQASPVTLHVKDRPLSEVLQQISAQTGNTLAIGGGESGINDIRVDADFDGMPFWQAIDDLCQRTANHIVQFEGRNASKLGISRGLPNAAPRTYSGPLRGKVLSVRRDFSQQLDFANSAAQTHTFEIVIQVEWEEQFRLIAHRLIPRVIEVVTNTGQVLELHNQGEPSWVVANVANRQATFTLKLTPPHLAAQTIAKLRLAWEVAAAGDFTEVAIDDLASSKIYDQEDARVILENHVIRPYQRHELQLRIDRDLPDWTPREMFHLESDVLLLDGEGKQLRLEQANWTRQSTGLHVRSRYMGSTAGAPKSVLVRYPRIRDKREIELEFNAIPLPRAIPD